MSRIDGGLRAEFRKHLPQFDWCSIESGTTGGGIPDSNYCHLVMTSPISAIGTEGWIEYKQTSGWAVTLAPTSPISAIGTEGWIEYKQTSGWAVTLAPEQVGWITRRVRHGGRVWIAVRRRHDGGPRLGAAVDALHLFHGRHAVAAKSTGLRGAWAKDTARVWHDGPSRWDWQAIARVLVS